jgi:predicted glutamine amidotransferase
MCRLFGMTGGTREVQATFWLLDAPASLLLQSENQPDGVGLGTFKADGTSNVYRKPVAANRSETFITGALNVRSATFLSHIRHATVAEPNLENTHPFEQNGRLMAHNGVLGDVPELRRRLGSHVELVHGETDSEHFFALITKRIDEHGGDVAAGIGAAAREAAAELPIYSLNIVMTTPSELWALRYPATNELWILERSLGIDAGIIEDRTASGVMRINPGVDFEERSAQGMMRVQSRELSILPATVIASEPMDANPQWRLLESGELIHVDPQLRVTSTIAVPDPPAHLIDLSTFSKRAAIAQGEEPAAEVG